MMLYCQIVISRTIHITEYLLGMLKEDLTTIVPTKSDSDVILSNTYKYKQPYYWMGNLKEELTTVVPAKSDSDVILSNSYEYK